MQLDARGRRFHPPSVLRNGCKSLAWFSNRTAARVSIEAQPPNAINEDPATRAGSPTLITSDLIQILLPYANLRTGPGATDAPVPLAIKG